MSEVNFGGDREWRGDFNIFVCIESYDMFFLKLFDNKNGNI